MPEATWLQVSSDLAPITLIGSAAGLLQKPLLRQDNAMMDVDACQTADDIHRMGYGQQRRQCNGIKPQVQRVAAELVDSGGLQERGALRQAES